MHLLILQREKQKKSSVSIVSPNIQPNSVKAENITWCTEKK